VKRPEEEYTIKLMFLMFWTCWAIGTLNIVGCLVPSEGEVHYYYDPAPHEEVVVVVEEYPQEEVVIVVEEQCYYTDVPYYNDPIECDFYGYCTWGNWYGEWYCYETFYHDELCGWEFVGEECF